MRNIVAIFLAALVLTGCADHVSFEAASRMSSVGFWYGFWHGAILPFAWVASLFDENVAIYAIYNNGAWYDFGYVLGAGVLFGGGASTQKS
jgi:hypothetical protein